MSSKVLVATPGLLGLSLDQIGSNSLSSSYCVFRFPGNLNHPEWNPWLIKNDVGLLTLVERLQWSAEVRPAAVHFGWVEGGEELKVNGFGKLSTGCRRWSGRLRQCEERVREANAVWGPSPPVHEDVELCAMHDDGAGQGLCNGDSGSTLTVDGRQVALVSWGWACALGHPDVHRSWEVDG